MFTPLADFVYTTVQRQPYILATLILSITFIIVFYPQKQAVCHAFILSRMTEIVLQYTNTPIVGNGLNRLFSLASLRNMKELFQEGFTKVADSTRTFSSLSTDSRILQYPDSAFRVRVFPFGMVTVLTNRNLIEEMNRASPDSLSFDEVSHKVCVNASNSEYRTFSFCINQLIFELISTSR